ncbi:MAG TPA: hypothetical protein H9870_12620 [Candidatus Corynebacterium avicola]|uniref:Uncharacterized protein n=1 Tax=Candidatus Corynebacterium avicola TaxID=2838527 RepID=A0A9D1ULT5_9CORY|nr:hypothetical protein [Candidatus Corynebacterium avicola]
MAVTQAAFLYRKESTNMDINGLIEPFQQFADHLQGAPEHAQPAADQAAPGVEGLEQQPTAPQGAEDAQGAAPEAPTDGPQGEAPADAPADAPEGEAPADGPQGESSAEAPSEAPEGAPDEAPAPENGEDAGSVESSLDSLTGSL